MLCIVARSEERRQSELLKRQQYQQGSNMTTKQGGSGRRNAENAPHETSVRTNERKVVPNTSNAVKSLLSGGIVIEPDIWQRTV